MSHVGALSQKIKIKIPRLATLNLDTKQQKNTTNLSLLFFFSKAELKAIQSGEFKLFWPVGFHMFLF